MIITIRKEHCLKGSYTDPMNCPLYLAIKEQAPDFPLFQVGVARIYDTSQNIYHFEYPKWNSQIEEEVRMGDRGPVTLNIKTN